VVATSPAPPYAVANAGVFKKKVPGAARGDKPAARRVRRREARRIVFMPHDQRGGYSL